jgi:hypothetical protein
MRYTMAVSPLPGATRVHYTASVDTAALPLPPPIRAVIEASMAASFQALVAKFVAFASARLGGGVVEVGGGDAAKTAPLASCPPLPAEAGGAAAPWMLASPRGLAQRQRGPALSQLQGSVSPALSLDGGPAAAWTAFNPVRHWRLVDTEGAEYWDAPEALTPRDGLAESVWSPKAGGSAALSVH